jgi:hypothetical protein
VRDRFLGFSVPQLWTVLVLAVLATAVAPRVVREMPDFEVYHRAGIRALAAEPLYRAEDGHFQHKYLPVFAVLAAPLALLPLTAAKTVWFVASVGVIALLVTISLVQLPDRRRRGWVLAAFTTAAMLKFYAHELNLGQSNALMALLAVASFGSLRRGRPVSAGAWLAGSAAVKPYTLLVLPYLAWTRRSAALAAAAVFLVLALLLPAILYGVRGNLALLNDWIWTVTETTAPNLLNQDNVSVWAMYAKWFGIGRPAGFLAIGTLAALFGLVAAMARLGAGVRQPEYLEMATLLMLVPLVSPQGWDYGLLAATPAVMLLVDRFDELPRAARIAGGGAVAVMALSLFDVMGRRAYAAFMSVSAITVCALLLVGTLAVMRLRRIA